MSSNIKLPCTKLFINNEWVDSKTTFPTINPYTEEVITHCSEGTPEDVDRAVKAARESLEKGPWSNTKPSERSKLMMRLADLIDENKENLAKLESLDVGKPYQSALEYDIFMVSKTIRYFAGCADKIHGKTITTDKDHTSYTLHEPIGVVGAIIPWNYPMMLLAWKLGPAFATGCTVVCKQSEITPLTAYAMCELIVKAGFPPGVFNLVAGYGHTVGNAIAHHMGIDKITFTGSNRTGRLILAASANSNLKKVSLELGGKSPNIVFPDVDMEKAIEGSRLALYSNSGESCCAGSRLYVHESIFDEFKKKFVENVKKVLVLGDPLDFKTNQGPMASKDHLDRVLSYIEKGISEGATLELGGKRLHGTKGYFVEPTIFTNIKSDMCICREEIFGPVVCLIPFKDADHVIEMSNDTEYGLASGIWTKDISTALYVSQKLKAGSVWINEYYQIDPSLPFGDYKGFGKDLSVYSVDEYLAIKTVSINHSIKFK